MGQADRCSAGLCKVQHLIPGGIRKKIVKALAGRLFDPSAGPGGLAFGSGILILGEESASAFAEITLTSAFQVQYKRSFLMASCREGKTFGLLAAGAGTKREIGGCLGNTLDRVGRGG